MSKYQYETVTVSLDGHVAHVQLNRPKKLNAFNHQLICDVLAVFGALTSDGDVRAIVVSGAGRVFTSGLDLGDAAGANKMTGDPARGTYGNRAHIKHFQAAFTAIEECEKPVIVAIHNACIGAGVDMITACDIRYCSKDTYFSVREVDVGLAADVGTLQRLPKVMGHHSLVRELCLTGQNLSAEDALRYGLVSKIFDDQESVVKEALKTAVLIASKSPVAVVGTKHLLNYSRDHSVAEGLTYTLTWSAAMLNTEDIPLSVIASRTKSPATFSKL